MGFDRGAPRPTWTSARRFLASWDGGASELFVLDLPWARWKSVVRRLSELPELELLLFDGEALGEGTLLDPGWARRLETFEPAGTTHALRSAKGSSRHLQIYLWTTVEPESRFDVEFVFWNDVTFPSSLTEREREKRLDHLLDLAEACRSGTTEPRCVLCGEHNGDPRELLANGRALVW